MDSRLSWIYCNHSGGIFHYGGDSQSAFGIAIDIDYAGYEIGFKQYRKIDCETDSDADSEKTSCPWYSQTGDEYFRLR
jgi:hypothetical protein